MRRLPHLLGLLLALAAALCGATPATAADGITRGTIYRDAPDNRYLVGGTWLFRLDRDRVGVKQRYMRQTSTDGWTTTAVPNAWNAGDNSVASMIGTVGWYRKDFRLPDRRSRMDWLVRLESVNYRTRVWMNGKPIGSNTGAYLPFVVRIPRSTLKRDRHQPPRGPRRQRAAARTDFPPSGQAPDGTPGRRLVELRGDPARGLPAARGRASTSARSACGPSCAAAAATRPSSCARPCATSARARARCR